MTLDDQPALIAPEGKVRVIKVGSLTLPDTLVGDFDTLQEAIDEQRKGMIILNDEGKQYKPAGFPE